ncbi:MAG: nitrite reductase (NAD(P)H) small subunit [Ignavibacteriaceae bacterium]|nr:nitrite reductase (NAD(P)H) small subunit [Ignavibacteriaceae bacterium]
MIEDGFTKLCKVSELQERKGKRFIVDGIEVALFNVDNEIYALSNICPHKHTALIYDGFIEDGYVVCPAHGWMFDIHTGKLKTGKTRITTFPVQVKDNYVFIKVTDKE